MSLSPELIVYLSGWIHLPPRFLSNEAKPTCRHRPPQRGDQILDQEIPFVGLHTVGVKFGRTFRKHKMEEGFVLKRKGKTRQKYAILIKWPQITFRGPKVG